jgi:hypothetical protein
MKDPRRRSTAPPAVTTPSRSNRREPRLPHERDESSTDAQAPVNPDAQAVGEQAARDIERGLVDTDRGPVLEQLNQQHFTPAKRRAGKRTPRSG